MGRVLAGSVFALIPLATSQGHDFLSKPASNLEQLSLNASAANVPDTMFPAYCGWPISSAEKKCPHMSCCGTGVDGLKCATLCSPVSDQCHEQQSTEHEPYYFDCQVCEHGNSGTPCYPYFRYASPRSGSCHSDNSGDDGFYYIDCKPAEPTCLVADQVCGNNNVQSQACCAGLECTPLLGGSAMKCTKPHDQCVAVGGYCGSPGQPTDLECCSGVCEYPADSTTKQCIDHAPCTDTPNWHNGYPGCKNEVPSWSGDEFCTNEGWTCSGYAWHGWCMNNQVNWGKGNDFKNPEWNCCACGKR